MKNFFLGSLFTIIGILVVGIFYLRLGFAEVRGDVPPSTLEASLMRMAVHASVRRHAPAITNPIAPTNENLIAGGKMYLNQCAGCHGSPGKVRTDANALNPPAPALAEVGTEYSEAQIFWVVKHGIRRSGMFANGIWESDDKLWTLAGYIKRIKNLPPGVPERIEEAAKSGG